MENKNDIIMDDLRLLYKINSNKKFDFDKKLLISKMREYQIYTLNKTIKNLGLDEINIENIENTINERFLNEKFLNSIKDEHDKNDNIDKLENHIRLIKQCMKINIDNISHVRNTLHSLLPYLDNKVINVKRIKYKLPVFNENKELVEYYIKNLSNIKFVD